jgi:hypothetical protein
MTIYKRVTYSNVLTVGDLKRFLAGIPDETKIQGDFDGDTVVAELMADEKTGKPHIAFENGE